MASTYIVYQQATPTPTGRKLNRNMEATERGDLEEHAANLVALGHVIAENSAEAFEKAKRMTKHPVLEEVSHANH